MNFGYTPIMLHSAHIAICTNVGQACFYWWEGLIIYGYFLEDFSVFIFRNELKYPLSIWINVHITNTTASSVCVISEVDRAINFLGWEVPGYSQLETYHKAFDVTEFLLLGDLLISSVRGLLYHYSPRCLGGDVDTCWANIPSAGATIVGAVWQSSFFLPIWRLCFLLGPGVWHTKRKCVILNSSSL